MPPSSLEANLRTARKVLQRALDEGRWWAPGFGLATADWPVYRQPLAAATARKRLRAGSSTVDDWRLVSDTFEALISLERIAQVEHRKQHSDHPDAEVKPPLSGRGDWQRNRLKGRLEMVAPATEALARLSRPPILDRADTDSSSSA